MSNRPLLNADQYLSAFTSSYHITPASGELQISRSVVRILDTELLICYVISTVFLGKASLLFSATDLIDIIHLLCVLTSTYGSYAC